MMQSEKKKETMEAKEKKPWCWTRISMKDNREFNQSSCPCMNKKCCCSLTLYQILLGLICIVMGFMMGLFMYNHIGEPAEGNRVFAIYRCVGKLTTWGFVLLYLYVMIQTTSSFFPNIWSGFKVLTWLLRNIAICMAFSISFMYWVGYFQIKAVITTTELTGLAFLNTLHVHCFNSIIALVSLVFGTMPIHLMDFDLSLYLYTVYYFFYLYWCNFVIGDYLYFSQYELTDLQHGLLMLAPFAVIILSQLVMYLISIIVHQFCTACDICFCGGSKRKKKKNQLNLNQNMAIMKLAPDGTYTKVKDLSINPYEVAEL